MEGKMQRLAFCGLFVLCLLVEVTVYGQLITDQDQAQQFLDNYNIKAQKVWSSYSFAAWDYSTNITDYNFQKQNEEALVYSAFNNEAYQNATLFDTTNFDYSIQREFSFLKNIGSAILEEKDLQELYDVLGRMSNIYSTGKICNDNDECYNLEPGLSAILATSTDYDELVWAWKGWRDEVGRPMRNDYVDYIRLNNKAAVMNGYEDYGDYWRSNYESETIEQDAESFLEDIMPLYKELHAYVRRRLSQVYGEDRVNLKGGIPANLLGDMWGRFWTNIYQLVEPFPNKTSIDVTPGLVDQGYDPDQMFLSAQDFFVSLGLPECPQEFWDHSMKTRPTDGREVECHATAWDFYNQIDFRIKMCTEVTMEYFLTIHHEMGHIQYDLAYKEQPVQFRDGANEAFHEAVGEVMSLSVATPKHLQKIGLLDEYEQDDESVINFLLKQALDQVATLPFSLTLDQWRWDAFREDIKESEWMKEWWDRKASQIGVVPPVERDETDFDPGAMFHIANDFSFLRYYIRTIIEFQFYKSMCDASGHTGDLYTCDFYNSTSAGNLLNDGLKLGKSRPWPEAMQKITGEPDMKTDDYLTYFNPLYIWLQEENKRMNNEVGWDETWRPFHVNGASRTPCGTSILLSMQLIIITWVVKNFK